MNINIYNILGKKIDDYKVSKNMLDYTYNKNVVFRDIVALNNNKRQVTAKTKDRSEVSGGGKKPWKQKGTGNARQGSIRSPQWVKGGRVHGPSINKNYINKVNRKEKNIARKSMITYKLNNEKIKLISSFNDIKKPSTKKANEFLNKLNYNFKYNLGIILKNNNYNCLLSFRNIKKVEVISVNNFSSDKISKFDYVYIEKEAFKAIEEMYK